MLIVLAIILTAVEVVLLKCQSDHISLLLTVISMAFHGPQWKLELFSKPCIASANFQRSHPS